MINGLHTLGICLVLDLLLNPDPLQDVAQIMHTFTLEYVNIFS